MATLHGILAELGIEYPSMHPEREVPQTDWVFDEAFNPAQGSTYEVVFAKLNFDGQHRHVLKRIRVDGPARDQWIDLDHMEAIDDDLQESIVKAYRPME